MAELGRVLAKEMNRKPSAASKTTEREKRDTCHGSIQDWPSSKIICPSTPARMRMPMTRRRRTLLHYKHTLRKLAKAFLELELRWLTPCLGRDGRAGYIACRA